MGYHGKWRTWEVEPRRATAITGPVAGAIAGPGATKFVPWWLPWFHLHGFTPPHRRTGRGAMHAMTSASS